MSLAQDSVSKCPRERGQEQEHAEAGQLGAGEAFGKGHQSDGQSEPAQAQAVALQAGRYQW